MSASDKTQNNKVVSVVALALRHDPSGEYLLARRNGSGAGAGEWEFPGGKIEPGEKPEQALVREIKEELAYSLAESQLSFVAANLHEYPNRQIEIQLWAAQITHRPEFKLTDHDQITWMRPEKMQEINLSAGDKHFISLLI